MDGKTKYITILRNPITQIQSVFYYQEFDKLFTERFQLKVNNSRKLHALEIFLQKPMTYYRKVFSHHPPEALPLLRNGMLFDLGFNTNVPEEFPDDVINEMIKQVSKDFNLVLITEYFDEGLVLLMREFCWSFDDIIYLKQNAQTKSSSIDKEIPSNLSKQILEWNRADYLLYQHFNKTFWNRVEKHGPDFWQDVVEFRRMKQELNKQCSIEKYRDKAVGVNIPVLKYKNGKNISRFHEPFCNKLFYSEIEYLKRFKRLYQLEML